MYRYHCASAQGIQLTLESSSSKKGTEQTEIIKLALHSTMVSWTDCAGKHQHCGALGWGGLIISLWNIHYSTWNYTELTGLQVRWEVHDPLEKTQSHSGMKPFHFAPRSSRALPPTCCSADAFSLLIPVILACAVVCRVCAICSAMGPWIFTWSLWVGVWYK